MQDVIEFSKAQFASFTDVQVATSAISGGAMINLGNGSSLLLPGVNPASLHARISPWRDAGTIMTALTTLTSVLSEGDRGDRPDLCVARVVSLLTACQSPYMLGQYRQSRPDRR